MKRRTLLAALAAAGSSVAGCAGHRSEESETEATGETLTAKESRARHGIPPDICEEEIREDTGIPAIVEPTFGPDWRGIDVDRLYRVGPGGELVDEQTVVGLADGDRARAYPIEVLWYHEIVNDRFGSDGADAERPVMITYCPLCRSGVVADRVILGEPTNFIVSGLLWQAPGLRVAANVQDNSTFGAARRDGETDVINSGNLVMYDQATRSYWSQVLAEAICGPLKGQRLTVLPSTVTTWGDWRTAHPETDVLLPPPHSKTVDA